MISLNGDNLVFLIGPPRSGTTLLSALLSNAPELYCPPERWIALAIHRMVSSPSEFWAPTSDEYLTGVALNDALSSPEQIGMAREFLQSAYNWWLQQDGEASIFVDKTPRYFKVISFLSKTFENARFIFLTRNPLDIAGSHKARWGVDLGSLMTSESWDTAFDVFCSSQIIADAQEQLPVSSHHLRYEDLVAQPEQVLHGVFDYLGLPFRAEYLNYQNNSRRSDALRVSNVGDRVLWTRTGITSESVDSWKTRLGADEVSLVAGIVGQETFERLGYDFPVTVACDNPDQRTRLYTMLRTRMEGSAPTNGKMSEDDEVNIRADNEVPMISIITPSFNQGQWIEETIQSVAAQDYPRFEHIIVDGGSTDETVSIVAKYPHVRFIQDPDFGQSHAINKGILASSGQILAYLNSDDIYLPGAFRAAVNALSGNDSTSIVVGNCDRIDDSGQVIGHLQANYGGYGKLQQFWRWDQTYCTPQQAFFWRRSVTEHIGLFDSSCHYSMDYDMWMRILAHYPLQVIDKTLAGFRSHVDSKTVSQTDGMYIEHLKVARRYWPSLWKLRRWQLELIGCHFTGKGLMVIAEHVALSNNSKRKPLSILGRALCYWPPLVFYPRTILSAASTIAAQYPWGKAMHRIHREYLSVRYRIKNLVWK